MSNWPPLRAGLTLFCVGMVGLHLAVFWLARRQAAEGLPDFRIFYTSGLMLHRGQGALLYDDGIQLQTQREFAGGTSYRLRLLPYNHPPFEAILYLGLASYPYFRAYELWFLVNLVFLAGFVYLAHLSLPELWSRFPELLFLAPLAFFPVAYALMQGQDSILLMLLYCLAYTALRRGEDLKAGAFLGLGLFKFHLVLPFVFILLLGRRWRALGGVLLSTAFDGVVSLWLVGWNELLFYPRYALKVGRERSAGVIVPENMANLRGLFLGWPWPTALEPWLKVALVLVCLCLMVWAARSWRAGELAPVEHWNTGFSIAVIATFLVGYHGYNQDMSILLLPALLTLDRVLASAPGQGKWTVIFLGLMWLSPLTVVLTLHYGHQNLFALVLLGLAASLRWSFPTAGGADARSAW
jgi:Glycosyltransferase family 87